VIAFFSPSLIVRLSLLSLIAFSLTLDFYIAASGYGNPEAHPLSIFLSSLIIGMGIILNLLWGILILEPFKFMNSHLPKSKEKPLRWN